MVVIAITLRNTRYLWRAVAALRTVEEIPDELLTHVSLLGWEHANLTGDYAWVAVDQVSENPDGFRSLRSLPKAIPMAA